MLQNIVLARKTIVSLIGAFYKQLLQIKRLRWKYWVQSNFVYY